MQRILIVSMTLILGWVAVTAAQPLTGEIRGNDDQPPLRYDVAEVVAPHIVGECGVATTAECPEGEHQVTSEAIGFNQWYNHTCWEPIEHSGPPCTVTLVPLEQLLEASPSQVLDWVAEHPRIEANLELERIELLDCAGDHVLAAASFGILGIGAADLD